MNLRPLYGIAVLASLVGCNGSKDAPSTIGASKKPYRVVTFSLVEIEPIKLLREGFNAELRASSVAKDRELTISEENAQGDNALVGQIADKIAANPPDAVYVLGTPAAQAIQRKAPDLLVLQGAVTDPVAAGLAKSWQGSGKKYIATSDLPDVRHQLDIIAKLLPKAKRVGVLYNPGEVNSVAVVKRLRGAMTGGLSLVERPVANTAEIGTAAASLIGRADIVYIPPDNVVHGGLKSVGKVLGEGRLPWFATTEDALPSGALAVMGLDYAKIGAASARLLEKVYKGADPATQPIEVVSAASVLVKAPVAKKYGIDASKLTKVKIVP